MALHDCLTASARIESELPDTLLVLGTGTVQTGRELFAMILMLAAAATKLGRTVNTLKRPRAVRRGKAEPAAPSVESAPSLATSSGPAPTSGQQAA